MKERNTHRAWLAPLAAIMICIPSASFSTDLGQGSLIEVSHSSGDERIAFNALKAGDEFPSTLTVKTRSGTCKVEGYFHGVSDTVRLAFKSAESRCGIPANQSMPIVVPIESDWTDGTGANLAYVLTERFFLQF